jgi:hypothetical protein
MKIIDKFKNKINGILSGFDRMIIKGHIRQFFSKSGKAYYMSQEGVLLKDFTEYAEGKTNQIRSFIESYAKNEEKPIIYLNSSKVSKVQTAKDYLKNDPIDEGLICIISAVEKNKSMRISKNKKEKKLELINADKPSLHYYFYYLDKEFGFMHVKLQTWFPFGIQIYINGREYIRKQLDKQKIGYSMYDNSFTSIDDIETAQNLADKLQGKDLSNMFDHIAHNINPLLKEIEKIFNHSYYWCLDQCEYATDVMFKTREDLELVYKDYVNHAIISFKADDVMTFLGRKMHHAFSGEVVSDTKNRIQGIRIKHRMKKNSIKMYDKNSVLRVETTINDPREFKIYKEVGINKEKKWVPMGKSIANLYRYAQVSASANKKYLDTIAQIDTNGESIKDIEKLCNRITSKNHTYSAINPLSKESEDIFVALFDNGNHINGFTNASIRKKLFPDSYNDKRVSTKVTRLLRKYRAHKLISKIPHSSKYKLTVKGIKIISACLIIKNEKYNTVSKAS